MGSCVPRGNVDDDSDDHRAVHGPVRYPENPSPHTHVDTSADADTSGSFLLIDSGNLSDHNAAAHRDTCLQDDTGDYVIHAEVSDADHDSDDDDDVGELTNEMDPAMTPAALNRNNSIGIPIKGPPQMPPNALLNYHPRHHHIQSHQQQPQSVIVPSTQGQSYHSLTQQPPPSILQPSSILSNTDGSLNANRDEWRERRRARATGEDLSSSRSSSRGSRSSPQTRFLDVEELSYNGHPYVKSQEDDEPKFDCIHNIVSKMNRGKGKHPNALKK